ncbi:hypothetical protein D9611_002621 [Ephemerocybe angulata]|uniref:DH domain-containing protein n=1 Tax=Ephemerocybe angulata TaxID=980116 RepID=A0A8H5C1L0_9AGAR|nr:hypothetical protein D9611_002621 [Tulosesus angulatus]
MAHNPSPRKTVPLSTGEEHRTREPHHLAPGVTKRVFYSSVVVEGSEHGVTLPDEIQELVVSLGRALDDEEDDSSSSQSALNSLAPELQLKRTTTDESGLSSVINELVTSERTYVKRLQILKNDYADPLRNFARSKETAIIPMYEAKVLFGNIDALLPVNEAFLTDLEKMLAPNGANLVGGVGDVALKHFRDQSGFEQYKLFYPHRESAQELFEKEGSKRSSRFVSYIEHIKYQSTDPKNRVGLRELLMEPVQRIPRYTLLFKTMLKHMGPEDPQRAKIEEAMGIASNIALAEADDPTKRAAAFFCMSSSIDNFPASLFSNSRKFIDCLDVQDIIGDVSPTSASGSGPGTALHCTLFLFDDKLMIVKRPNGDKGGKTLSGLDNMDKFTKSSARSYTKRRTGMTAKGVLDLTDIVISDPGGANIHMYLEKPPLDQSERWSNRPFRSLVAVNPPAALYLDPVQSEADKKRFLEHLWEAQAKFRATGGKSVVLVSPEEEVENRSSRTTTARTFYNVYTRTSFLQDPKKTKVVVHIDPLGTADPIPFGLEAPPYVCIRLQPIAGGLCRFAVSSSDAADEIDEDIVQLERVPSRIVHTIHQFGLFQFKTGGRASVPGTPTARSKASIFGLDTISRNLFSSRPGSVGDFFGGTITSHRRSKSATSRSSIHTQTNSTADSSLLKSHRSYSTAATSIDGDSSSIYSAGSSKGKPTSSSRKDEDAASENGSIGRSLASHSMSSLSKSLTRSKSQSTERPAYDESDYSEAEDEQATISRRPRIDSSDHALQLRLDLARQNSLAQHGKPLPPIVMDQPVEETIYEEEPPEPVRKQSLDAFNRHMNSRSGSPSKIPESHSTSDLRPPSRSSRPSGPRAHSPLPSAGSRSPSDHSRLNSPEEVDTEHDSDCESDDSGTSTSATVSRSSSSRPSGIPRNRRQIFPSAPSAPGNLDATPRAAVSNGSFSQSVIGPLSIKKKTSTHGAPPSTYTFPPPSPTTRRSFCENSPLSRGTRTSTQSQIPLSQSTSRLPSPPFKHLKKSLSTGQPAVKYDLVDDLVVTASNMKDDIESSHRTVKRIKAEVEKLAAPTSSPSPMEDPYARPNSPDKTLRTPTHNQPLTKEAQQRLDEMRNLIGRRQGDITPRRLRPGMFNETPKSRDRSGSLSDVMAARLQHRPGGSMDRIITHGSQHSSPSPSPSPVSNNALSSLTNEADAGLAKVLKANERLESDLRYMAAQFKEKLVELERTRNELVSAKRQTELVKNLLSDATTEKEIMYEALNEELDAMFNDAHRPGDEGFFALSEDLKKTVAARNEYSKENSDLKRQLAEVESQRDEYADLLRKHGLIQ